MVVTTQKSSSARASLSEYGTLGKLIYVYEALIEAKPPTCLHDHQVV